MLYLETGHAEANMEEKFKRKALSSYIFKALFNLRFELTTGISELIVSLVPQIKEIGFIQP